MYWRNVEITNILPDGLTLTVDGKEFFLSYRRYPWFRGANESAVRNVELLFHEDLRWNDLDVDLELDSLEHPENYPLVFNGHLYRH